MYGSTVERKIKSFDIFRKLPQDYTQSTTSGAFVSIVFSVILLILVISEFSSFLKVETRSEMSIVPADYSLTMRINLDIVLHKMPCNLVGFSHKDVLGTNKDSRLFNIIKKKVDENGKIFSVLNQAAADAEVDNPDIGKIRDALRNKEGCQIVGFFEVSKVPGQFQFGSQSMGSILQMLFNENDISVQDYTHTINHLSFGFDSDYKEIKKTFLHGNLNTLDGFRKTSLNEKGSTGTSFQYYLNIVPSEYKTIGRDTYLYHQYTANANQVSTSMLPNVLFKYDFSGVTVRYSQKRGSLLHFLVQVCAIIGGTFTIAGLIDALVYKFMLNLLKKSERQY